ncbi:MAG: DUF58 domain-containing protein [Myxococcota bacterium]
MSAERSLLDPDFLRRLARLRLLVRRRFAGASGSRRSTRKGQSVEFADHRPYYPGDDIRRIDWNAYARLEELVLRLYVAEEDVTVTLLLDTSKSMEAKFETAKRIAAALAYVGLSGSERVGVAPFADQLNAPLAPTRGKGRIGRVLRYLDELTVSGETDLGRSIDSFLARRPRPGLVIVLSDLLLPTGFQRPLDRLIAHKHEPVIFQILAREELSPPAGGDFTFVDSERGTKVEVSLDERALRAYRARLAMFLEEVETYARRRGLSYVRAGGDVPFEDALMSYLRSA